MSDRDKRQKLKLAIAAVGEHSMRYPSEAGYAYGDTKPLGDGHTQMNNLHDTIYSVTQNVFSQISINSMEEEIRANLLLSGQRRVSPRRRPDSADRRDSRSSDRRDDHYRMESRGRKRERDLDLDARGRRVDQDSRTRDRRDWDNDNRDVRGEYEREGRYGREAYALPRRESDPDVRGRRDDRGRMLETDRRRDYDTEVRIIDYGAVSRRNDPNVDVWNVEQQAYINSSPRMDIEPRASALKYWPEHEHVPQDTLIDSATHYWTEQAIGGQERIEPWPIGSQQALYDVTPVAAAPAGPRYPAHAVLPIGPAVLARPVRPMAPRALGPLPGALRPRVPAPRSLAVPVSGVRGPAPPGTFRMPAQRVPTPGHPGLQGQPLPRAQPTMPWTGAALTPRPVGRPPAPGAQVWPRAPVVMTPPAISPRTGASTPRFPLTAPAGASPLLSEFLMLARPNLELINLTNHVAEFALDIYGSRFIQENLPLATPVVKAKIMKEVLDVASSLIEHPIGSFVIQKCFEIGSLQEKLALGCILRDDILRLALHTNGSKVIQSALASISPAVRRELILELDGNILACAESPSACHVLQKAFEVIDPDRLQFIIDEIIGQVGILSKSSRASRVIQRILEYCTDEQKAPVLVEITDNFDELVYDQFGNYVLQRALEYGNKEDMSLIISNLLENVVVFSKHKIACNVVEKCVHCLSSKEVSSLVKQLCTTDKSNANVLVGMLKDKYANYAVKEIIEVASEQDRTFMLKTLSPHIGLLSNSNITNNLIKMLRTGSHPHSFVPGGVPYRGAPT